MNAAENNVSYCPLTPVSFLRRSAAIYPRRTAVIHGDQRWTYLELEQRVARLASRLRSEGLKPNDRVAFLCPNTPPLLESHFGVPAAGGILVAINTRLSAAEIEYILRDSGAKWLFFDESFAPLVQTLDVPQCAQILIRSDGDTCDGYEAFLAGGDDAWGPSWLSDENDTLSINYTSGTTGKPKGVMYTFRGAYLNAINQVLETGMNRHSVYLWTLPMFHCNGWCFPWAVTAVAATHVCLRRPDPERIWQLLEDEKVTHYCGSPTLQIMLMNHASARQLQSPVTACVAGAPPSPTLLEQMSARNIRPAHVYGLTETYGPITSCVWQDDWAQRSVSERACLLARQGHSQWLSEQARVVDKSMKDVPRDGTTMGEVVFRGNTVMKGYFQDEATTESAFRDGWFHTGDLGVWHPDGSIELRDRKKDIIISGGENISTIELEQVIARHPSVLECAVIAVPDDHWGERPKAFVTLKPSETLTEPQLIAFCREHLAHFKCPKAIEFGELPKTSTGKIQKFLLREKEWNGFEKRIH